MQQLLVLNRQSDYVSNKGNPRHVPFRNLLSAVWHKLAAVRGTDLCTPNAVLFVMTGDLPTPMLRSGHKQNIRDVMHKYGSRIELQCQ